jgi:SAM-dependent methyltransferase
MTVEAVRCRLCGASAGQRIRGEHVFGGTPEHRFWECEPCGAIYLLPVPSEVDEARFYAREFERFMASRSGGDRDWTAAERHVATNQDQVRRRWRVLEPFVGHGRSVLEIGCSTGFMLDAFRDAGMRCTGVEPSGAFLEFLGQRGHDAYVDVSTLRSAAPGRRWDLITHFFVFEHVRDPWAFIGEQLELLADDGAIVFEVPCALDALTSLYRIPAFERFYWSIAHHFYYVPRSVRLVMDRLPVTCDIIPEQRYDLSNHLTWLMEGRPGGQGKFLGSIARETHDAYRADLVRSGHFDSMFVVLRPNRAIDR